MTNFQTKEASPLALLAGPAGHVLTNALGRAAHHKSNLQSVLAHKGLQHALTDSRVAPTAMRTTKSLLGPESVVPYEVAHRLGERLKTMAPAERAAFLQKVYSRTTATKAPVLSSLREAVGHEIQGTAPTLQAKGLAANTYSRAVQGLTNVVNKPFDTGVQRAVKGIAGAAPLATLAVADPLATGAHVGINAVREVVGKTTPGKRVMTRLFEHGLAGKPIARGHELAADYLLSPAVLDPYRAGKALHREASPSMQRSLATADFSAAKEQLKTVPGLSDFGLLGSTKTAALPSLDKHDLLASILPSWAGFYFGDTPQMSANQARDYARRDFSGPEMALMQGYLSYKQGRSSAARRILRDARYPQLHNPYYRR